MNTHPNSKLSIQTYPLSMEFQRYSNVSWLIGGPDGVHVVETDDMMDGL